MSRNGTPEQKGSTDDSPGSLGVQICTEHVARMGAALDAIKKDTRDADFCDNDFLRFCMGDKWKQTSTRQDSSAVWYGANLFDCYEYEIAAESIVSVHRGTTWTVVRTNTESDNYHTFIFLTANEDGSIPTSVEKENASSDDD